MSQNLIESDEKAKAEAEKLLLNLEQGISIQTKGLIHTDANGEVHCYLLEHAIKNGRFDIAKSLLLNNTIKENEEVLENAILVERKTKDTIKIDKKLAECLELDKILSIALKEIKDNNKMALQESINETTTEMFRVRAAKGESELHEAMCQPKDLKEIYKTTTDRGEFHSVYSALEAQVRRERDPFQDKAYETMIGITKSIQKRGVRTGLEVGGLIALGVTTGGIGLGVALASRVAALAVATGHQAWLEKTRKMPEDYKACLDKANAALNQAHADSLKALKIKREQTTVVTEQKTLDALITAAEIATKKAAEIEQEVEGAAITMLVGLIRSGTPNELKIANEFLLAFDFNTKNLQEEGAHAFSKFRDKAKQVVDRVQKNSTEATNKLNAVQPFDPIDDRQYSDLMYKSLESQAAVSDVVESLDAPYSMLKEVQRRDAFYVKLAQALQKAEPNLTEKRPDLPETPKSGVTQIEKAKKIAEDKGLTVHSAIDTVVGNAATLLSGQDAAKNVVGVLTAMQHNGLSATVFQNPDFQKRAFELFSTVAKEATSKIAGSTFQESISHATEVLYQNFSSTVLDGISSAHLMYDISPAGACTMLALLIYTSAHNKLYSKELNEQFSKIIALLDKNKGDISTLNDDELKELQKLTGETIHKFGTLLPKSMDTDLERSKKLYEAQVKRTQLLSELLLFSGIKFQSTKFNDQGADKKKIYIITDPGSDKLTAHYHNGKAWCRSSVEKTRTEFAEETSGMNPLNYSTIEIEKIADSFGCKRELSEDQKNKLAKNKKKLDQMYMEANQKKAADQMLYCLTDVYRGVTQHMATKSSVETRGRLFELSRQTELMSILATSGMAPPEYEKALPVIQKYVSDRKALIDTLNKITRDHQDKLTPNELEIFKKYQKELEEQSKQPYEFLKDKKLDYLETIGRKLDADSKSMLAKLVALKNPAIQPLPVQNIIAKKSEPSLIKKFGSFMSSLPNKIKSSFSKVFASKSTPPPEIPQISMPKTTSAIPKTPTMHAEAEPVVKPFIVSQTKSQSTDNKPMEPPDELSPSKTSRAPSRLKK